MIDDLRTVLWKEWRSLFRQRGSRLKTVLTLLTPLAVFGVWFPWEAGTRWLEGPVSVFAALALPLMVALLVVPDSFAGERERHTLPTLLASRLPDRAILFGKVAFAVGLAWGLMLLVLLLSLVVVNFVHADGRLLFFSGRVLLADLSLGLAVAVLTVEAGVLLSLRAQTVQEAQQTLSAALLLPPTLLGPVVLLMTRARPEWGPRELVADLGPTNLLLLVLGALVAVDLVLLLACLARFERSRLSRR